MRAELKDKDFNITVRLAKCIKDVYQQTDTSNSISEETGIYLEPVGT